LSAERGRLILNIIARTVALVTFCI